MIEPILHGKYYHIYNRGINSCNIFESTADYEHFLKLYDKYISSIAETYAWCLLKNHFHLLVRIKEVDEIGFYKYHEEDFKYEQGKSKNGLIYDDVKWQTTTMKPETIVDKRKLRVPNPTSHFKHLFNSYAKHFNLTHNRHGALLERPFLRKKITHEKYFKQVIIYIQNNPVKHGFVNKPIEWGWSSFLGYFSDRHRLPSNNETLRQFGDLENFKAAHSMNTELIEIENMLGVE
ncbi:MAG: hypothetical protein PF517_17490 [Salinivirgaceae bacterium]|jgi:putative transposase|nr:hypothetical protein [Salinivirgaceae bacterium]